LPGLSATFLQM